MLLAANTVEVPIEGIIAFLAMIVPPTIILMTWQVVSLFKLTKLLLVMEVRLQRLEEAEGIIPPNLDGWKGVG